MWQCAGTIWHVWQVVGAPEGPMSPLEGPNVSLLALTFDILAFNVTNNGIMLSQPCRLFLMTYFVIQGHLDDRN